MIKPPQALVAPKGTVWFGGPVDKSYLTLRVYGDKIVPSKISAILGHSPTESWKKGDATTHKSQLRRNGAWFLKAPVSDGADIDGQIDWIFSKLTKDMKTWKRLTSEYRVDLSVALYLEAANRGVMLSPKSMKETSRRGLLLGFDIYYWPNKS